MPQRLEALGDLVTELFHGCARVFAFDQAGGVVQVVEQAGGVFEKQWQVVFDAVGYQAITDVTVDQ